jgi:hypothetical protein
MEITVLFTDNDVKVFHFIRKLLLPVVRLAPNIWSRIR